MSRVVVLLVMAWFALSMGGAQGAFVIRVGAGEAKMFGTSAVVPVGIQFTSDNPAAPENDFINAYFFDLSQSDAALTENDYARITVENERSGWQFLGLGSDGVGGIVAIDPLDYLVSSVNFVKLFDLRVNLDGLANGSYLLSIFKEGSSDASGSIAQFNEATGQWEQEVFSSFNNYPTGPGVTKGTIDFNAPGATRIVTNTPVIPEPSTIVIFAIGASALVGFNTRRKKR